MINKSDIILTTHTTSQTENDCSQGLRKQSVLVVLVNYKRPLDTVACIESLLCQDFSSWQCIVYENGSGDNSYSTINGLLENALPNDFVQETLSYGERNAIIFSRNGLRASETVAVLEGNQNLGFAGGNNAAIRVAAQLGLYSEHFVWFLNNDTVVEPTTLSHLVGRMNEPGAEKVGLCGATMLYFGSDNTVQCYGGAAYTKWFGRISELGNGERLTVLPSRKSIETRLHYVSGASMFARNEFIAAVGTMSEDYFLYFEELDWAVRGKRLGFELGYAPEAKVWHREGAVLGSGKATRRSPLAEFFGLSSRIVFTMKYFPEAIVTIWLAGSAQVMRRLINRQWPNAKALLLALFFRRLPKTK